MRVTYELLICCSCLKICRIWIIHLNRKIEKIQSFSTPCLSDDKQNFRSVISYFFLIDWKLEFRITFFHYLVIILKWSNFVFCFFFIEKWGRGKSIKLQKSQKTRENPFSVMIGTFFIKTNLNVNFGNWIKKIIFEKFDVLHWKVIFYLLNAEKNFNQQFFQNLTV